jgi:hypothetical protein
MNPSFAFSFVKIRANNILPSENLYGKYIRASEFVKLSVKEFGLLTGRKLNFMQRLSFNVAKLRMKHDLKKNPNLEITDYLNKLDKDSSFGSGWFLLGMAGPALGLGLSLITITILPFIILGITPVVIAYATKQNKASKKSVWIGLGSAIIFLILIVLLILATSGSYID